MAAINHEDEDTQTPLEQYPKLKQIVSQWTQCADCSQKDPKWTEVSRGTLICLQCSGVHRHLGTDVSKVRSLTLDKWTQPMVDNMSRSEVEFNKIWEFHVDPVFMKPIGKTKRYLRSKYIEAKYRDRMFHEDNHQRLDPVFASTSNDESDEEIISEENANLKLEKSIAQGMVQYTGVIKIHLISANHLPKNDLFGQSDPYVVFGNGKEQEVRSKTIDCDKNPIWNQHLILSVNEQTPITIKIFDEDKHSKDDLLCTATLDVGSKCTEGEVVMFDNYMLMREEKFTKKKKQFTKKKKQQSKVSTLKFSIEYEKMDAQ